MSGAGGGAATRVALAASLFVYLSGELFTIGAAAELVAGLGTTPARVGLLLTGYAVVAGTLTLPSVVLARRLVPRLALGGAMLLLGLAQAGLALAPDYGWALAWRLVAALGHGLVWSQAPLLARRLAAPGQGDRALASVFYGASLALLLGAPLSAAAAQTIGWRAASGLLAVGAVCCAAGLWRLLPGAWPTPSATDQGGSVGVGSDRSGVAWRPVVSVCLVTVVLVVGHYVGYGYLEALVRRAGLAAGQYPWLLAGYGLAGIIGVAVTARTLDRHRRAVSLLVPLVLTSALTLLVPGFGPGPSVVALLLWGAAAAALPAVLNTAAVAATRRGQDTASAAYVVAYQVGISVGAAVGALTLSLAGVGTLPSVAAGVLAAGTLLVLLVPALFGARSRPPRPGGPSWSGGR